MVKPKYIIVFEVKMENRERKQTACVWAMTFLVLIVIVSLLMGIFFNVWFAILSLVSLITIGKLNRYYDKVLA